MGAETTIQDPDSTRRELSELHQFFESLALSLGHWVDRPSIVFVRPCGRPALSACTLTAGIGFKVVPMREGKPGWLYPYEGLGGWEG